MSYCNQRISFADVTEIRRLYAAGDISVRQLAERFNINYYYCYHILQGSARQSEDARRPIVAPPRAAREFLRDPAGSLFIRRGKRRGFARQIDYKTVVLIRHAYETYKTSPADLAVKFGVSLSHVRRIIKKQTRRNA